MCLLDEVLEWDADRVLCRTESHRAADNPLRAHGRLGSASAIEYAAQAVAVHGALLQSAAEQPPEPAPVHAGVLASVRGVQLTVERLDDIEAALLVEVQRLHANAHSALYFFRVSTATHTPLAHGRLSLWLDQDSP